MRYLLATLFLLLLIPVFLDPSHAAPRTDCGKVVSPGQKIQDAINNPPDNNIICVKPGNYYEVININKPNITLTAFDPASKPTLDGKFTLPQNKLNFQPLIKISSHHNTVENLIITKSSGIGISIHSETNKNLSRNTIKNNLVAQTWNEGIFITGSRDSSQIVNDVSGTKIIDNFVEYNNVDPITKKKIHKKPSEGGTVGTDVGSITLKYARGVLNDPDKVILIEGNTMSFASDEQFMVDNNWGRSKGIIIRNNVIKNSIQSPVYLHGADDIIFDSNIVIGSVINNIPNYGCIIFQALETQSGNKYRQQGLAKSEFAAENIKISNNLTIGCSHSLVLTIQDIDASFKNLKVNNNTFANIGNQMKSDLCQPNDRCHDIRINITPGHNYNTVMTNTQIKNNIFYHAGNFNQKLTLLPNKTIPKDVIFQNNIWSKNPGTGFNPFLIGNPKLAGVNPNTGSFPIKKISDRVTIPDVTPNDFMLSSSSPAINQSNNIDLKTDFFDNSRPYGNKSDIGAHEYGGKPGPTNTPLPTQPTSQWDLNNDNTVDILDFSEFILGFSFSDFDFIDLTSFISSL